MVEKRASNAIFDSEISKFTKNRWSTRGFTGTLFRPVNVPFPTEFTKSFSQSSLCCQQILHFFFLVFANVIFIHNAFHLSQSCFFFRNLHYLHCFLHLAFTFFYVIYIQKYIFIYICKKMYVETAR